MRRLEVYRNAQLAGILTENNRRDYVFRYDAQYFNNAAQPGISLTLPKTQQEYRSEYLFPCFFNLLSEGANRQLQSIQWRVDEEDYFGLLAATAQCDTIGAIHVKPVKTA
jgi:serine/threonine-protein kinase HipA